MQDMMVKAAFVAMNVKTGKTLEKIHGTSLVDCDTGEVIATVD